MQVIETLSGGVKIIKSPCFEDDRGSFTKLFNDSEALKDYSIEQVNFVKNKELGTLRGLHFQSHPYAESKFFRVIKGEINLVYLNSDQSSNYYNQAGSYLLSQSTIGILIPEGFATGYEVLKNNSEVLYFSNKPYKPEYEKGVNWQNSLVHQHWITKEPIVSIKDQNLKI